MIKSIFYRFLTFIIAYTLIINAFGGTKNFEKAFSPKVIVLTAFPPEWHSWTNQGSFHFKKFHIPGLLKPLICDHNKVCVTETGEGEINAAITVTSLIKNNELDVKHTIFIRSGIAGGLGKYAIGSVSINSWVVSWAFGHHYLTHKKTLAWAPPSCANYSASGDCNTYTQDSLENLAYRVNPKLVNRALIATKSLHLDNSLRAKKIDREDLIPGQPTIIVGATITGDDIRAGLQNESIAEKITSLYTHGQAVCTNTAMEDLGDISALTRFGMAGNYLSIRAISVHVTFPLKKIVDKKTFGSKMFSARKLALKNLILVTEKVISSLICKSSNES